VSAGNVLCLSGGVGGAKLLLGLQRVLPAGCLTAVVNTGDDFDHLGLRICPDVDTALYTLGGLANQELGWGRRGETWHFMETLESLGGETWFRLGDADLALHVERTRRLRQGQSLTEITADIAERLNIPSAVLPMSDDRLSTMVVTDDGELAFQDYFVRLRCEPVLRQCRFDGADKAQVSPAVKAALGQPLRAVLIAPSNPWLSIAPILALAEMKELLQQCAAPVIAVTPVMGGDSVKGPTAKIMAEMGLEISPASVAACYAGIIDGFVLDSRDRECAESLGIPVSITDTLMKSDADKERVALAALALAENLGWSGSE